MEFEPHLWYSPRSILSDPSRSPNTSERLPSIDTKLRQEMHAVSLMLLGMMRLQRTEYWLQPIHPREQAPDVRIGHFDPQDPTQFRIEGVEVVRFTPFSSEQDIDDFLRRTKLSPLRAYTEDTRILCFVDGRRRHQKWQQLHEALQGAPLDRDIYILHQLEERLPMFELARVYPELDGFMKFHPDYDAVQPSFGSALLERVPNKGKMRYDQKLEMFSSL